MNRKEISFPQRSQGGLAATDVFYRNYNEIYFYVEDAGQENLYFSALSKLFHDIDFAKIFPLGGKPNVLKHAKDDTNSSIGKRVYILDKDFDDLLGTKENIPYVFYLDAFCVENYFLDEDAVVELVLESFPKLKRDDIREELSLDIVIPEIGESLKTLFALFFFVQLEKLEILNTSQKPEKFCKKGILWETCPKCIENYLKEALDQCRARSISKPDENILEDFRLCAFRSAPTVNVVSGKFWLKMLFHYVKSKYTLSSITFDSFVFRVAKKCSLEELRYLVEEIKAVYPD